MKVEQSKTGTIILICFIFVVGLLRWAMSGHNVYRPRHRMSGVWSQRMRGVFKALLPG
jgi:hypothetical protein